MVRNTTANAGGVGLIPGSGRFPGEGNGNLLQYSCLEDHMDRGAWRAIVHGSHKKVIHDLAKQRYSIIFLSISTSLAIHLLLGT